MSKEMVPEEREEASRDLASCPIVELRQYTLHEGMRDRLIGLFEREFVETQEAFGMRVIGTFRDLDRPERFVWLRGFADMDSRLAGLSGFYSGAAWLSHRDEANATMIDSDDVLLLRAGTSSPGFEVAGSRPCLGEDRKAGVILTVIEYLKSPSEAVLALFQTQVKSELERRGISPIAWFVTETSPNNFPRLPVRSGEQVLVWFARFADEADERDHRLSVDEASEPLFLLRARAPEVLRLAPTSRSGLR
jgi:hypothetical protein